MTQKTVRTLKRTLVEDRLQGIMINIPMSIKLKLQKMAQEEGVSMAALVRHQITDWMQEYEEKQGEVVVETPTSKPALPRRGRPKSDGRKAPRYRNFALPRLREIEHATGNGSAE